MVRRAATCGFVLIATLLGPAVLSGQDAAQQVESENGHGPKVGDLDIGELRRLSPTDEVWLDVENRTVTVGGQVCLDEGPLEMFACTAGTKEYESIVAVNAKAQVVHTALLAIGAKPGHPVRFRPEYRPANGTRIAIRVEWRDASGAWIGVDAKEWVQDSATEATLGEDWVFGGSQFWKDPDTGEELYLAEGGELICVSNFATATMDLPIESSQSDAHRVYQAFTSRVPPIGTRVRLVLKPELVDEASATRDKEPRDGPNSKGDHTEDAVQTDPGKLVPAEFIAQTPEGTAKVPYLLFTPSNYKSSKEWPLILFLHGYGESGGGGDELEKVKIHGPPMMVAKDPEFPFVVLAPQCPLVPYDIKKIQMAWSEDQIVQLLDHVVEHCNVDSSRVYLTGLSMGGFGTWRMAARYPNRFAAAVPICGGGKPEYAKALASVPIWCFHGREDGVVPHKLSKEMVDAVKKAGGTVLFTSYPKVGHASWARAYNDKSLFAWLLSCRRKASDE